MEEFKYLDDKHNFVSEEDAKWKVVYEYKDGKLMNEKWVILKKEVKKDTLGGYKGKWITLDNGQHIFIREGESVNEAVGRLKPSTEMREVPKQLKPLAREAMKYDTAEEFKEAMSRSYTTGMGDVSRDPTDVKELREEMGTLADYDERTKRDWFGRHTEYETSVPEEDEIITIYRSTKGDNIRPGDYVTQSKEYAESHLESVLQGEGKIITVEATIKDLSAVNPNEFWYAPEAMEEYDDIKDFWKEVHNKKEKKEELKHHGKEKCQKCS